MKGPIVSIDVSNGNSHFQCFTQRGTKMGKVHRISHTVEGFNCLKSKIEELEKKTNEEVDRKSTRLNSSHIEESRMPSSA